MTPELAATLRNSDTAIEIAATCSISAVQYAGDEGGIVCGFDVAAATLTTILPRLSEPVASAPISVPLAARR